MLTCHQRCSVAFTWEAFHKCYHKLNPYHVFGDYTFKITTRDNPRRGRECRVPTISPSAIYVRAIQTIRFSSLPVKGPRLFNVLPKDLRDMSGCSTERFKGELDYYLETIPDEPLIPGLTQYRRCDSNSVIDWAKSPYLHQQNNQLQETNYPELDEVVTTWWPVGFHEHYRVIPSEWVITTTSPRGQWVKLDVVDLLEVILVRVQVSCTGAKCQLQ